jgi:hypothetical protein
VKLTHGTAFQIALHDAFPYALPPSVAVAVEEGSQLPHCVVLRSGTRLLREAYGGAYDVVVLGAGRDVAVRRVSVCVKLNSRNEYEGSTVA